MEKRVEELDLDEPKTSRNTIDKKLGSALSKNWTAVPVIFLESYAEMGLSPQDAMFILHLLSFKKNELPVQARMKFLEDKMGVSYSTVRRCSDNCQDKGIVRMIVNKGYANRYDLSPLIEEMERRLMDKKSKNLKKKEQFK